MGTQLRVYYPLNDLNQHWQNENAAIVLSLQPVVRLI